MTEKQKKTLIIGAAIIVIAFIVWGLYGGEIFTKNQVLVEKYDEILDTTYKEWKDKFIWGLDLTLAISGATALVSAVLFFLFGRKKVSA